MDVTVLIVWNITTERKNRWWLPSLMTEGSVWKVTSVVVDGANVVIGLAVTMSGVQAATLGVPQTATPPLSMLGNEKHHTLITSTSSNDFYSRSKILCKRLIHCGNSDFHSNLVCQYIGPFDYYKFSFCYMYSSTMIIYMYILLFYKQCSFHNLSSKFFSHRNVAVWSNHSHFWNEIVINKTLHKNNDLITALDLKLLPSFTLL